jgi:steroid 5-alpha reductase family enzyme
MVKIQSKKISTCILVIVYASAFLAAFYSLRLVEFANPIVSLLIADIIGTVVVFLFSMIFNNSSVYDPYWSIAPALMAVYLINLFPQGNHIRQFIILTLVLFWSIRLTANWLKGWNGLAHQDWRYSSIAQKTGRGYWPISFLGIHLMPTLIVYMAFLPLWYTIPNGSPLSFFDILAALFTLAAILTEWAADEQLQRFRKFSDKDKNINSGLWKLSRHPNYLGEISFWGGLFLFVMSSGGLHGNDGLWTVIGFLSMILLFKFISIPMMEKRNLARKPEYVEYIKQVPALFPPFYKKKA